MCAQQESLLYSGVAAEALGDFLRSLKSQRHFSRPSSVGDWTRIHGKAQTLAPSPGPMDVPGFQVYAPQQLRYRLGVSNEGLLSVVRTVD